VNRNGWQNKKMAVVKAPKCMQSPTVEPDSGNKIHLEIFLVGLGKKSFLCARFPRLP